MKNIVESYNRWMIEVPFAKAAADTKVFYRLGEEDFMSQINFTA
jgi:hypothetical protein